LSSTLTLMLPVALTILLVGCSQDSGSAEDQRPAMEPAAPSPVSAPPPTTAVPSTTVNEALAEPAARPNIDATFEVIAGRVAELPEGDLDDALATIRLELRAIDAKIDSFELTALVPDEISEQSEVRRDEALQALKARRASIDEWLKAMRPDSDVSWDDARSGFAADFLALGYAMQEAEDAFGY